MATTVARLEAVLGADTKQFDRAMTTSQRRMQTAGKFAGRMGILLSGVLGVGAVKAVRAASDLNEEIDKSRVVFGKASQSVLKWSGGTASDLGLSQRMALQAAGAYGNMFKTIGLGDRPAADMSKRMVQLAADMASFSNEDPSEMLLKLRSGLAGEAEPLRQFGVLISEARVKTEAYRLGLAKSGEELTEQQKVQARYSLILKDSAIQHGNFALTSESAANQQRILRAQVEDLSAKLGNSLLPAFKSILQVMNTAITYLSENKTQAKALTIAIGALAAALVTARAAQLAMNLAVLANPYVAATVAILALAAGVALLWQRMKELRPVIALVSFYILGLPAGITLLLAAFNKLKPVLNGIAAAFERVANWAKAVVEKVKWLIDNIGKLGGALGRIPGVSGGGGGPSSSNTGLIPMVENAVSAARSMGWRGRVTSGFRTYEEQSRLYQRYLRGGPLAAAPGTSSHEKGQAVDVTDYGVFGQMMSRLPHGLRLYNKLGARDPVHFSVTGYARGGIVPGPIGMPQLAMVHGGETITPPGEQTINLYVDGQKLFSWFRDAEKKDRRRNGR